MPDSPLQPGPYGSEHPQSDKGYTSSAYGPGIGPGDVGFGRRSTSNSSQTSTTSNPSPKDSTTVRRRSFGPDKMKPSKRQVKPTKPVRSGTKSTVRSVPKDKKKKK
ncbi:MAG TPA: hypothetical protein VEP90_18720 [Methylomirabilota bacterium]|nr:hypothetical protein [Methylomirabilota bacterium]